MRKEKGQSDGEEGGGSKRKVICEVRPGSGTQTRKSVRIPRRAKATRWAEAGRVPETKGRPGRGRGRGGAEGGRAEGGRPVPQGPPGCEELAFYPKQRPQNPLPVGQPEGTGTERCLPLELREPPA